MTRFVLAGWGAVAFTVMLTVELVHLAGTFTRCTAIGHDGVWTYRVTSGDWLCHCRHCDIELGRHRP